MRAFFGRRRRDAFYLPPRASKRLVYTRVSRILQRVEEHDERVPQTATMRAWGMHQSIGHVFVTMHD